MDRRDFLSKVAVAGGLAGSGLLSGSLTACGTESADEGGSDSPSPLSILILGGTNLTGPHNVRYALERGHSVTTFTRGRTQPGLFQDLFETEVEQLIGDRENDLEALRGRTWDAVIDASGMRVEWTTASAELLADSVDTYMYISSTGVFYPYLTTNITEDTEPMMEDPSNGENGASAYGVMKAQSEAEVRRVFGDRALNVRPGYIVGPLDSTNRGTYWPERLRRGGDVMVPGRRTDQVQQIDVRDLTEWMIRSLENGTRGTYNVTGPGDRTGLEQFVTEVQGAFDSESTLTWIEDYDFLTEHSVGYAIPWIMASGDNLGSQTINIDRAKAAGLTFRPIAQTARETLEWYDSRDPEARATPPMAISPEKEAEVLAAWRAR